MRIWNIALLAILSACGGGGGETSWSGPVNSDGFPMVGGRYAVTISDSGAKCRIGDEAEDFSSPPSSLNANVLQSGNTLVVEQLNPPPPPAALADVILSHTTNGHVQKDGSYILRGEAHYRTKYGFARHIIVTTGQFFVDGFAGDQDITLTFPEVGARCDARRSLSADKLG